MRNSSTLDAEVVRKRFSLARELGSFGIRANAIARSILRNERIEKSMPADTQAQVAEQLPTAANWHTGIRGRGALSLASDASSWITGHVLDVNGGKIMV